jgi:ketosteroid isomerase-like protein
VRYLVLTSIVLITSVFAQTPTADQPGIPLPPELARVLSGYEAAWRAKNANALSQLFAENGFVMASGVPMVRGRAAIEKLYNGDGGPLYLRAVAYATEGKVGYILGGYRHLSSGPDDGKFTLTLQKDASGKWLIMSDMDNGNRQPRPASP